MTRTSFLQAPHLLLLRDASTAADAAPVGMYLHSRRVGLFAGAHQDPQPTAAADPGHPKSNGRSQPADPRNTSSAIPRGATVRLANVRAQHAPASTGIPPRLLPTVEMVVLARDRVEAASMLRSMSVSMVAQVRRRWPSPAALFWPTDGNRLCVRVPQRRIAVVHAAVHVIAGSSIVEGQSIMLMEHACRCWQRHGCRRGSRSRCRA